jgi:signal transduction histidine kinase
MQAASAGRVTAPVREDAGARGRPVVEPVAWTCAMAVLVGTSIWGQDVSSSPAYLILDIAVGVVSLGLVPLLARWPVVVAVLLSALAALSFAATPPATLAVLLVARWRRLGVAAWVAGAGVAAHLVRGAWRPLGGLPFGWWAVLVGVAYAALVAWGMLLRANQALISSLRERAEHAEAEQARRVTEARTAERTRIAREMHDVLAHRLSLLATYAGALSYRPDAPPEQLSRAAEVVRSEVHQALEELREVIGVLRDESMPDLGAGVEAGLAGESVDPAAGGRPMPSYGDLDRLLSEVRAAGMCVTVSGDAWDPALVPEGLGRTVYRVVQEGLTNARKHAPGATVRVVLAGGTGTGLDVSVVNAVPANSVPPAGSVPLANSVPLAGRGSGVGLIGLAERVELAGGRLESGAAAGEFLLRAWLPWAE